MASQCYVSARDFQQHFEQHREEHIERMIAWSGIEQRIATKDRRTSGHDRRWQAEKGRRYRPADRRKATA